MRRALWAVVTLLALVSVSCAGGTEQGGTAAAPAGGAGGTAGNTGGQGGGGVGTCGNGIVEPMSGVMGEQCEGTAPITATSCFSLGMGTGGNVACNPATCRLSMDCADGPGGMGGSSAGGVGGMGAGGMGVVGGIGGMGGGAGGASGTMATGGVGGGAGGAGGGAGG